MKIIKYKKIRNKYRIYFDDNETIDLFENVILNNNLLLKKEIDDKLLFKIKKENDEEEVYEKALRYISIKMRTRKEIRKHLSKCEKSSVERCIEKLEKNGLINDEDYIKAYINDKINLSSDGPFKIKNMLLNMGMDEKIIYKYISEIDEDLITEKLDKLIDKKIKSIKNYSGNVLKYKIISYFINLGYNKELIEKLLENKNFKNDNIVNEYNKLLNKYSRKYEGSELKNIIKQKLYQKGYDINDIDIN